MRRPTLVYRALVILAGCAPLAGADEFPRDLVAWSPSAANPVFRGAGYGAWDRKIRERGWILLEGGTYHLWYSGYNDACSKTRSLGHATSSAAPAATRFYTMHPDVRVFESLKLKGSKD
jgi:hypothetical protein